MDIVAIQDEKYGMIEDRSIGNGIYCMIERCAGTVSYVGHRESDLNGLDPAPLSS